MTIEEEIRAALLSEYEAIPPIEELEKMHTFSERHEKQMMELFAEVERRDKRKKIWRKVQKVAVIAIAILAATFVAVKFVPVVYAYVQKWFAEPADNDAVIFRGIGTRDKDESVEPLQFSLKYIPEGYELESENYYRAGLSTVGYKNQAGEDISFTYRVLSEEIMISVNTKDAIVKEELVNDIVYNVFVCEGRDTTIVWEIDGYMFKLNGMVEEEYLLNMAASMTRVKK